MSATLKKDQRGFTLVEMIVVVAVLGILVAIVIPALLTAVDRSRQRRSMADMRNISKANGVAHIDSGQYVATIAALSPNYILNVPTVDAWGNPWVYVAAGSPRRSYELRSLGKLGAPGPPAPTPWFNEPFEVDLVMLSGEFSQMPRNQ